MYQSVTRNIEVTVTPRIPRRSLLAGDQRIFLGLHDRDHQPWNRDGSAAHAALAHHRRDRTQAGGARAGVVGKQPVLKPGESFEYTSGVPLPTPSGFMTGSYGMVSAERRAVRHRDPDLFARQPGARKRTLQLSRLRVVRHVRRLETHRSRCRTRRSPRSRRSRPCRRGRTAGTSAASPRRSRASTSTARAARSLRNTRTPRSWNSR